MSSVAAAVHERRKGIPRASGFVHAPSGLFLAAVLIIMALPVTRTIQDPDFWWHLRAGQLIIQHGGLLGNDPFTYTVANHHWTMHEWLNEVLFAIEYAVGGLGSIVLILSAITWLGLICGDAESTPARPGSRCARFRHARSRSSPDSRSGDHACRCSRSRSPR